MNQVSKKPNYDHLKGLRNAKSVMLNHQRAARNKLDLHLRHFLKTPRMLGMKLDVKIDIFTKHYNIEVTGNKKKWLYEIYETGENEIIKRLDDSFYSTQQWRDLRERVILTYGNSCMKCSKTEDSICVDHILPRSKYPKHELDFDNMQILCSDCNLKKSNKDMTDYRNKL